MGGEGRDFYRYDFSKARVGDIRPSTAMSEKRQEDIPEYQAVIKYRPPLLRMTKILPMTCIEYYNGTGTECFANVLSSNILNKLMSWAL